MQAEVNQETRKEKMNPTENAYSIGDNIVHAYYGVGQIVDIEDKKLNEKTKTYYVVETKDSTFWLPVNKADNERVRSIASSKTFQDNVVEALAADPKEMASHYQTRRKRIKDVRVSGEILRIAKLVRDLTYRRYAKGRLTDVERRNLDRLRSRLVSEWAKSVGTTKRKVSAKIRRILQRHQEEEV
jgi:CarD family transcriptional regulator